MLQSKMDQGRDALHCDSTRSGGPCRAAAVLAGHFPVDTLPPRVFPSALSFSGAAMHEKVVTLLLVLVAGARAGCPFGFSGDAEGGVKGAGRRLQQVRPRVCRFLPANWPAGRNGRFAASSRGSSPGGACEPTRAASARSKPQLTTAPPPQAGCNINTLAQQAVTTPFVPASPVQGQVSYKDPTRTAAWQPDMHSRRHPQATRQRLSHYRPFLLLLPPRQVDKYIKEVAWTAFQTGFPGLVPGLFKNGLLNSANVPLGGLLRLSFHDAGPFNR